MFTIIQAAGWPIWPLLICSIVALALVIERMMSLRTHLVAPDGLLDNALKASHNNLPSEEAMQQLKNTANLPFIFKHVAAMPDVHFGIGATVGSVIPTIRAIIPAAVGVDIGCGMMALQTTLKASDLPDSLGPMRGAIERAIPVGFAEHKHPVWARL